MRLFVAGVVMAMGLSAGCGWASEQVFGDNTARVCFEVSISKRTDASAVHLCDVALENPLMTPDERGGALVNRGVIRMRRGELAAAQGDFDLAMPMIPNSSEAHFNRGAVLVGEHRYKDALDDLDKAITLGVRELAKAYYFRGLAHDYLEDEPAAYRDYKQAQTLAPEWDLPTHELKRFTVKPK